MTAHLAASRLRDIRWEALDARRPDFRGAGNGVDEEATFRLAASQRARGRSATFGRLACILSGGTWTADRRARAGYSGDDHCPYGCGVPETPLHRWWQCPRWNAHRIQDGIDLSSAFAAAGGQPRCLWECGILPKPQAAALPSPPPEGLALGEPLGPMSLPPGATVYTDASAARPREPLLRRAACAIWVGPDHRGNAEIGRAHV